VSNVHAGVQDAMQRSALPAISQYLRSQAKLGRTPSDMKLLEVACGTGRFHTFIKVQMGHVREAASCLMPRQRHVMHHFF
jgi:ubiquinone/menaquinone biosynthesis C-methylase UbiE